MRVCVCFPSESGMESLRSDHGLGSFGPRLGVSAAPLPAPEALITSLVVSRCVRGLAESSGESSSAALISFRHRRDAAASSRRCFPIRARSDAPQRCACTRTESGARPRGWKEEIQLC